MSTRRAGREPTSAITLRASRDDARELHRLAALDSAAPLTGAILAGEQDGELRAAIALGSRRVIADPFHPTAELVELLETRAAQIHPPEATRGARVRARLRGIAGGRPRTSPAASPPRPGGADRLSDRSIAGRAT